MELDGVPKMDDSTRSMPAATPLDREIAKVRDEIHSLCQRRTKLAAERLGLESSHPLSLAPPLHVTGASYVLSDLTTEASSPLVIAALETSQAQLRHSEQCLYRLGAGATMFEVDDPDPNAVDGGRVFGVRIEAFASGKFLTPYYIFLNRPWPDSSLLCLHRHTIPPFIPLSFLKAKYLPQPSLGPEDVAKPPKQQDLPRLVRELRRELVAYHLRSAAISNLQRSFQIDGKERGPKQALSGVKDISSSDADARDIRLEWTDGRIGRIRIGKVGEVQKCVIIGPGGRERDMERAVTGTASIEGLQETLRMV